MDNKFMALAIMALLVVGISGYAWYYGEQQQASGYVAGLAARPTTPVAAAAVPSIDIDLDTTLMNFSTEVTATGTITDGDATAGELLNKDVAVTVENKGTVDATGLTMGIEDLDDDLEIDEFSMTIQNDGVTQYMVKEGDVRSAITLPTLAEDATYGATLSGILEETSVTNTLPDGATLRYDLTVYFAGQKVEDATISVLS